MKKKKSVLKLFDYIPSFGQGAKLNPPLTLCAEETQTNRVKWLRLLCIFIQYSGINCRTRVCHCLLLSNWSFSGPDIIRLLRNHWSSTIEQRELVADGFVIPCIARILAASYEWSRITYLFKILDMAASIFS